MQLTGKQIVNQGIISGVCDEGIQQQGVDVRVSKITRVSAHLGGLDIFDALLMGKTDEYSKKVLGTIGYVPAQGKTKLPENKEVKVEKVNGVPCWILGEGYYEVEFMEGCKIPANCAMYFKTRSSLVRCGSDVRSGQFDGGFETEKMGAFLKVELPVRIDVGARIAQAIVTETYPVDEENLYNGQWQNDNQRN